MPKMKKSFYITLVVITAFVICCFGHEMSLSRDIRDAAKGATNTFVVQCEGRCKDITATVKVDSGDPDLFASEEQPAIIGTKCLKFINYETGIMILNTMTKDRILIYISLR